MPGDQIASPKRVPRRRSEEGPHRVLDEVGAQARRSAPVFVNVFVIITLPLFALAALHIWRPGNPREPGKSVPDRIAWTVFAFGVGSMFTMVLYAALCESDGDYRTWETIRLHTRLFLAIAAIPIAGPLTIFLDQSRRMARLASAPKKRPQDELS